MNQNPPSAVEWSCFAVLAGVAVAPLDHKDISAKIYIMKLPTTAPTQKFQQKYVFSSSHDQKQFPTRYGGSTVV